MDKSLTSQQVKTIRNETGTQQGYDLNSLGNIQLLILFYPGPYIRQLRVGSMQVEGGMGWNIIGNQE